MRALKEIADHGNWSLELPLVVRGREISLVTLLAEPPDCYDGPAPGSRSLGVTTPIARGLDVRLVQLGLSDAGMQITADGVFGAMSAAAVKRYQKDKGLNGTGVANPGLIAQIVD
jgi:chitosanase